MKKFKKISGIICICLCAVVVLALLGLTVARFAGLEPFTVLSGSMSPEIEAGSVLLVKKNDPHGLQPLDVITFMAGPDTVVTHRIMAVVPDLEDPNILRFRTRGDANPVDDMYLVHENNVLGTPVLNIPYLGYVVNFVSQPPGIYLALAGIALMLILLYLPDLMGKEEKDTAGEAPAEEAPAEE